MWRAVLFPGAWVVLACGPVVGDDPANTGGGGGTTGGASSGATAGGTSGATTSGSGGVVPGTSVGSGPRDTGDPVDDDAAEFDPPPDFWHPAGDTGDCVPWATLGCAALEGPNATGLVSTPVGEVALPYAYFAAFTGCGECVEPNVTHLFLASSPAEQAPPSAAMMVELTLDGAFEGPFDTPVEAYRLIVFNDNDSAESLDATFSLSGIPGVDELGEPFDPESAATIDGAIDLDADGWSVHLTFGAAYCPDANVGAICE